MPHANRSQRNANCKLRPYACGLTLAFVFIFITACNRSPSQSDASTSTKSSSAATSLTHSSPKRVDLEKPTVQIDTSAGPITARLDAVSAPGTVRNFLNNVNEGFYDNTIVHYIDPGKMIVAGGYSTDNNPKPVRTHIRNEAHNRVKNVRGTIAMARDGRSVDSATTQFFINLADAPQRDYTGDTPDTYGYCVFGEVTEGLDIAEKISQSPTTVLSGDLEKTPKPPVVIKSIRVVR